MNVTGIPKYVIPTPTAATNVDPFYASVGLDTREMENPAAKVGNILN